MTSISSQFPPIGEHKNCLHYGCCKILPRKGCMHCSASCSSIKTACAECVHSIIHGDCMMCKKPTWSKILPNGNKEIYAFCSVICQKNWTISFPNNPITPSMQYVRPKF